MIFSDLQQSTSDRLLSDAYFTEPGKEVKVLILKPLDLKREYDIAIARHGAVAIIEEPEIVDTEGVDRVRVNLGIDFAENVTLNRSGKGSQKPAADNAVKALALLRNWAPDDSIWSAFYLERLAPLGEDNYGSYHWHLDLYTYTQLELLITLLGTETGAAIGDESGTAFNVSPTSA